MPGVPGVSVQTRQPGRAGLGVRHIIVVSEPMFRRFYKMILKKKTFFLNDFEIVYNMQCICI